MKKFFSVMLLLYLILIAGCTDSFTKLTHIESGPAGLYYSGIEKAPEQEFYIPVKQITEGNAKLLQSFYYATYDKAGKLATLSRYIKTETAPQMIGTVKYFYDQEGNRIRTLVQEMNNYGYIITYDKLYDTDGKLLAVRQLDQFGNPVKEQP